MTAVHPVSKLLGEYPDGKWLAAHNPYRARADRFPAPHDTEAKSDDK